MRNVTLNRIIEEFGLLPLEEKEFAVDIIEKQLVEAKREALARRAKRAMGNLKQGTVKRGTLRELYRDLESD